MKCPAHVGIDMKLEEVLAPSWVLNADGADLVGGDEPCYRGGVQKKFTRKFWKCPVAGCYCVAAFQREEEAGEKEARCPKCGGKSDAPAWRLKAGELTCSHCVLEAAQQNAARDRARRARGGQVGYRGHRRTLELAAAEAAARQ